MAMSSRPSRLMMADIDHRRCDGAVDGRRRDVYWRADDDEIDDNERGKVVVRGRCEEQMYLNVQHDGNLPSRRGEDKRNRVRLRNYGILLNYCSTTANDEDTPQTTIQEL
eukprot:scaffold2407_cov57-Cyclotella_meneghiniana.AAC.2